MQEQPPTAPDGAKDSRKELCWRFQHPAARLDHFQKGLYILWGFLLLCFSILKALETLRIATHPTPEFLTADFPLVWLASCGVLLFISLHLLFSGFTRKGGYWEEFQISRKNYAHIWKGHGQTRKSILPSKKITSLSILPELSPFDLFPIKSEFSSDPKIIPPLKFKLRIASDDPSQYIEFARGLNPSALQNLAQQTLAAHLRFHPSSPPLEFKDESIPLPSLPPTSDAAPLPTPDDALQIAEYTIHSNDVAFRIPRRNLFATRDGSALIGLAILLIPIFAIRHIFLLLFFPITLLILLLPLRGLFKMIHFGSGLLALAAIQTLDQITLVASAKGISITRKYPGFTQTRWIPREKIAILECIKIIPHRDQDSPNALRIMETDHREHFLAVGHPREELHLITSVLREKLH